MPFTDCPGAVTYTPPRYALKACIVAPIAFKNGRDILASQRSLFPLYGRYLFFAILGVKKLGGASSGERSTTDTDRFAVAAPLQPFGVHIDIPQTVLA